MTNVPDVDAATATDSVLNQQKFINKSFRDMTSAANKTYYAKECNKDKDQKVERASVVQGEMKGAVGNEVKYDDWRHISRLNCESRIINLMTALEPIPFLRTGHKLTVEQKYSAVNTSYRLGCDFCTLPGHTSTSCEMKVTYEAYLAKKRQKKRKASGELVKEDVIIADVLAPPQFNLQHSLNADGLLRPAILQLSTNATDHMPFGDPGG